MVFCRFVFFFKQKTAYEMRIRDWSSDVCSSDLHRRTDRGVFKPRRRADHANRDEASGDAKTDAERMRRRTPAPRQRDTDFTYLLRHFQRATRVVRHWQRRPDQYQDAIAGELLDRRYVTGNHVPPSLVVRSAQRPVGEER